MATKVKSGKSGSKKPSFAGERGVDIWVRAIAKAINDLLPIGFSIQITKCVQRGADLLDEKNPGWHARVDPEKLDTGKTGGCLLGQLYGGFALGLDALHPKKRPDCWATEHGFEFAGILSMDDVFAAWADEVKTENAYDMANELLNFIWKAEIAFRQDEPTKKGPQNGRKRQTKQVDGQEEANKRQSVD